MTLATVHLYVLGGTITMSGAAGDGIVPTLTGQDLLTHVPGLDTVANLVVHTPFLKPGASLTPTEIGDLIMRMQHDRAQAAVIVQGTDTIDETSFLTQLYYRGNAPIVVTGAMRGAQALSADGPANLMAAIRTAADPQSTGRGTLVVLNDEIHAAADVEKTHTGLVQAFQSPNRGPLGYCLENTVRYLQAADAPHPFHFTPGTFAPVAIVKAGLGEDDTLLQAIPRLGYRGLVLEAMGAGHVPASLVDTLGKLAQQMPVVLSTRVAAGPVFRRTYGFNGSETDLLARGLIPAGRLSPHKARLLLGVCLGNQLDTQACQATFDFFEQHA